MKKACNKIKMFIHAYLCSALRVVARVIQQGMSHVQMAVPNRLMNAPNRDPSNISSVKTKVIVDGVSASGKIALVPVTRSEESRAGMVIKIKQHRIVPTKIGQFHANAVMRHQIVS